MTNWYGWAGTILNVDLNNMKVAKEELSWEFATKYIGASGFGARILYDEVGPGNNALEPENVIIIGQGPLSATAAPSGGRYDLISKSPATGIYLRTNGGGFFGPEMRWAGYDLIIIRGKAEKPVYLWINDEHVELKDASHLWGKDTWTTQQMIREELDDPDIQVLKIGPAGENMCYSSAVISNLGRAAGTYSMGAVWGSKNLKAVAVRGNRAVSVARPKEFIEICKTLSERINRDPQYEIHSTYGTPGSVGGTTEESRKKMRERQLREYKGDPVSTSASGRVDYRDFDPHFDKSLACFACAIHCSHYYSVKSGKYKGTAGEGLELVTQSSASSLVADAAFICKYNNVCNQLGLDVAEPSVAIRWAVAEYQKGTMEGTGGLELTLGNEELMLDLLYKIAHREGIGELLDTYSLKRNQIRGTGILTSIGFTLSYFLSTRGPNHLVGDTEYVVPGARAWITDELLIKLGKERYGDPNLFLNPYAADLKIAQAVYDIQNVCCLCDMTGICKFPSQWWFYDKGMGMEDFAQLLSAATGVDSSVEELNKAADREFLLERAFNAREGMRRIDHYPFIWYYQMKHGKKNPQFDYSALPFSLENYDKLLDEYFRLRGCDREGIPTRERLEYLGMKDIADDLEQRRVLSEPGSGIIYREITSQMRGPQPLTISEHQHPI